MESIERKGHSIDAGRACCGRGRRRRTDNVNGCGAVVILAEIDKRNAAEHFDHAAKIILRALIVACSTCCRADFEQHVAVHHQHGDIAVDGVNKRVKLVNKGVAVAVQLRGIRQVNVGGKLIAGAVQQLPEAVKRTGHKTGSAGCGRAIDDEVVEIVRRRLDFLLCLERHFVNSTRGVLKNTVDLERTAHDHGLRGLFLALRFTCGVLGVDGTDGGSGRGLELNVTIGQRRTAGARRNGIVKRHSVEQERRSTEFVNDLLIYLVGHADLCFC